MDRRSKILCIILIHTCLSPSACFRRAEPALVSPKRFVANGFNVERVTVARSDVSGLSGLTEDGAGELVAIPEDLRRVIRIDQSGSSERARDQVLLGLPPDWDTESIAWLGRGRFALGTERAGDRAADTVFLMQTDPDAKSARVIDQIELDYSPWSLEAKDNRGIEGLCFAAPFLVMAGETTGEQNGRRFAPVAVYDTERRHFRYFELWLTSDEGRPSALACHRAADGKGLEVLAIERHYGIGRIIAFQIPRPTPKPDPFPMPLLPRVILELERHFSPLLNDEGLVWRDDGTVIMINDNNSGGVAGPIELVFFTPSR